MQAVEEQQKYDEWRESLGSPKSRVDVGHEIIEGGEEGEQTVEAGDTQESKAAPSPSKAGDGMSQEERLAAQKHLPMGVEPQE